MHVVSEVAVKYVTDEVSLPASHHKVHVRFVVY